MLLLQLFGLLEAARYGEARDQHGLGISDPSHDLDGGLEFLYIDRYFYRSVPHLQSKSTEVFDVGDK